MAASFRSDIQGLRALAVGGVVAYHFGLSGLPGGFADPADESYETAAARELQEECGALETTPMQYLGSVKIDDWRYRGETDKILSLLFTATLRSGKPQANDDLEALQWFDISALPIMLEKEIINAAHFPFINKILAHLNA